jgi:hypothetical protein
MLARWFVFPDMETLMACCPSPRSFEKSTRNLMVYLWFLAQKIRNRQQHAMNGNSSVPSRSGVTPSVEPDHYYLG